MPFVRPNVLLTMYNVYDNFFEDCAARTHMVGRMVEVTFSCNV